MATEIKKSGTKVTAKVTPRYPLETVRPLDNKNGERGTNNKPHFHINIFSIFAKTKERDNV